jgi:preprotein translocase subunit YajC
VEALIPFALLILVWYFLLVRPQQARARRFRETQSALSVGSEVVLTSGLHGRVVDLDDAVATIETSPGVTMRFERGAVMSVTAPAAGGADPTT